MMTEDNGRITRVRVEALEKKMEKLEEKLSDTIDQLRETQIALAGSRAEIRIFGVLIMAALVAVITLVINN